MRTLGFLLALSLLGGCATLDGPKPLTGAEIVQLAKEGKTSAQIIEELKRTDTVLRLQASDYVALHESGVPKDVLNYLQQVQILELRWRDSHSSWYWGPMHRGFGPHPYWHCPSGFMGPPYRGRMWAC